MTKTNYEKNGHHYFRITATVGKKSDGKPLRKEFYGKSKKDAELKRDIYVNGLKSGLSIDYQEITLGKFMHIWLYEVVKNYTAYSTFDRYECVYRLYISTAEINALKVYTIKSIVSQRYYNKLFEQGISTSIINSINKLLKSFFNYTIKEGYSLINPCFKAIIPNKRMHSEKEIKPLTKKEIEKALNSANGYLKMAIILDLATGLRRGELLALTFNDIDLEKKEINITKAVKTVKIINNDSTYKYKTIIEVPKTKNSNRIVPIPSVLISVLNIYLKAQKEKYLSYGITSVETKQIFSTDTCQILDGKNFLRSWYRCQIRAGIERRSFHNIRHTYATQLFEAGVELLTVSKLLGHSGIAVTAKTYTHVMPKIKIEAADKINHLFNTL